MTPPDPLSESARRHRATDDKCALCLHNCADGCPFESKLDAISKKVDQLVRLVAGGGVEDAGTPSMVIRLNAVEESVKAIKQDAKDSTKKIEVDVESMKTSWVEFRATLKTLQWVTGGAGGIALLGIGVQIYKAFGGGQ